MGGKSTYSGSEQGADDDIYDTFRRVGQAAGDASDTLGRGERLSLDADRDLAGRAASAVGRGEKLAADAERDLGQTAIDKFSQFRAEHPLVQALSKAAVPALVASTGLGTPALSSYEQFRQALSPNQPTAARTPRAVGAQGTGISYGSRDTTGDAGDEPPPDPMADYPSRAGLGTEPGFASGNGVGSDAALQGAQNAEIATRAGMADKQRAVADATGERMGTEATGLHDVAELRRKEAQAEADAAEQADADQHWHETVIQRAQDEVAAKGIDPGRFFKNRDFGFWSTMLIGSVASGMLSALTGRGGENPFMDSVRATVHDDINSQERDIDQGWRKVKGLETAYERARARGADKVTATISQYQTTLQALQSDIQAKIQTAKIPEVKIGLQQAADALQGESQAMETKKQAMWMEIKQKRAAQAAAAGRQAYEDKLARWKMEHLDLPEAQAKMRLMGAEADKAETAAGKGPKEDDAENFIPNHGPDSDVTDSNGKVIGKVGTVVPKNISKEAREDIVASGRYQLELQKTIELRKKYVDALSSPFSSYEAFNLRRQLETQQANLGQAYATAHHHNKYSVAEQDARNEQTHGYAPSLFAGDSGTKLKTALQAEQERNQNMRRELGGRDAFLTVDPQTGRPKLISRGTFEPGNDDRSLESRPGAKVVGKVP